MEAINGFPIQSSAYPMFEFLLGQATIVPRDVTRGLAALALIYSTDKILGIRELHEFLHCNKVGIIRGLRVFTKKGLLRKIRSTTDRRLVELHRTQEGEAWMEELRSRWKGAVLLEG